MATGTFANHPTLVEPLPPLVRKQRRLAKQIADLIASGGGEEAEKAIRKEIDALLLAAGLKKSELVTCLGYDVKHNERNGQSSINADVLTEQLVAAGIDRGFVLKVLAAATETGDPAKFATVTPSKGAKVRV